MTPTTTARPTKPFPAPRVRSSAGSSTSPQANGDATPIMRSPAGAQTAQPTIFASAPILAASAGSSYRVTPSKDGAFWMLMIVGPGLERPGVTQVRRLSQAEAMARDWLSLCFDRDADTFRVEVEQPKTSPQAKQVTTPMIASPAGTQTTRPINDETTPNLIPLAGPPSSPGERLTLPVAGAQTAQPTTLQSTPKLGSSAEPSSPRAAIHVPMHGCA